MENDIIAAIATPLGIGGIGIIRISGSNVKSVLDPYFKFSIKNQQPNTIIYNKFVDGDHVLDEVLVSYFAGPKSFTGEEIIEINCHGGIYIINKILDILINNNLIRLAKPGEFSKRAFLNGKKDINEIESYLNLIEAKSQFAIDLETNNNIKDLKTKIKNYYQMLITIIAQIEAKLDYPEYLDINEVIPEELKSKLISMRESLIIIKDNSHKGALIRNGIKTVIIGPPNAGKSSLLNLLAREEKAIVSDVQGTTRDVIDVEVNLGKIILNLFDTAGIRKTTDKIEQIGVNKSISTMEEAELIIFMLDVNNIDSNIKEYINTINKPYIVLINKCDNPTDKITKLFDNQINISIKNKINIDKIQDKILEIFNLNIENTNILPAVWQIEEITKAIYNLDCAINNINCEEEIDIVEIDLKECANCLAKILGINLEADLLNTLFSNYCLGK